MSDTQSQISKVSTKSRNRLIVCGQCGKVEGKNYVQHNTRQHKGQKLEWDKVSVVPNPWCTNWKEIATNPNPDVKIEPVGKRSEFKSEFKAANAKRATKTQSEAGIKPKAIDVYFNDARMEGIEERKVAVPVAGDLQTIKIQRKRPPTITQESIQTSVLEEVNPDDSVSSVGALKPKRRNAQNSNPGVVDKPLSSANLKMLGSQTQYQTPEDEPEFCAPIPIAPTVYRDQGMRDQEAIHNLMALERKTTGIAQTKVFELIKLTPFFAQPIVSWYIEQNKANLLNIKDLLLLAQARAEELSTEQISSIAFASVLFGGSVWVSLPKMFSNLDSIKLEDSLSLLCSQLTIRFNENLAKWVCTSWKYLEEQTLSLLRYLKESNLQDSMIAEIATISTMVQIEDFEEYLMIVEVFSKYQAFKIMLESIQFSAPRWKSEQKSSFDEFAILVDFLTVSQNKQLILKNEKDLIELPLNQWHSRLNTMQDVSVVCDVKSIQHRLDQLCDLVGLLPLAKQQKDLTSTLDDRFQRTINMVPNAPNALQFANAQFAAFGLQIWRRQMWMIPSGQGKSRTLATIALILLLTGATTKVHIVFDSKHFMDRDQEEFAYWWKLNGIANVEYHIGLDFESKPGDVILIDEADKVILSDCVKFEKKIKSNRCICMTATPDEENKKGVKIETLNSFKFKFINGWPEGVPLPTSADVSCIQTLPFTPNAELIEHIQKVLLDCAVLLYCSLEFRQLLVTANVPFILIEDGKDINDEFLRTLDIRGQEGLHTLLVTSSSFGMRGFDYRSPTKGIALIIATSFEDRDQVSQGLARVGRFGDPCKRIILKDINLVDKAKDMQYQTDMFQYLNSNQKNKIQFKAKEEQKMQPTTATNTTKSTPADGKSKKEKQQNSSSQSILTLPPRQNYSRRQTTLLAPVLGQPQKTKEAKEEVEDEEKEVKGKEEEVYEVITESQILNFLD